MRTAIERQRNILDFTLSSLLRRKAKNFSLLFLYILIIFFVASLLFFVQALKREAKTLLADAPDIVVQRIVAGRHDPIPMSYMNKLQEIRGVVEVTPRLWGYYYDPVFGANYTLMADNSGTISPKTIVIGAGVARTQRIGEDDMIQLRMASGAPMIVTVAKILPHDSELISSDMIMMSRADFTELFNLSGDHATDLAVSAANQRELVTIAGKIAEKLPDSRPILKTEIMRTYDSIFDWRGGIMVAILAVAVLSFAIFAWDKATGLSAEERREIGILKSIGWETSDVLLLKFWEGIAISLTSFMAGTILAYIHVFIFSAPLFEQALKGWATLYPRFRLVPSIDAYQIAVLFFLTVFPYTVATIVPSWLAATIDADTAMRS